MGLVGHQERWVIQHALYGLQESPGDWGAHRDKVLKTLTWRVEDQECHLVPTAERHVWQIRRSGNSEETCGFLLTYVDDMLVLGTGDQVRTLTKRLSEVWECSPPEFLEDGGNMRFCGFEFVQQGDGWKLCQRGYTKDLLARYDITSGETVPLPKLPDDDELEEYGPQDLRAAQSIVGELLWLSTRTRPDLCFAIGTLGRMVHKKPKLVKELGLHVLRYLWSTSEMGLVYQACKPGDLGKDDHLQVPRSVDRLEVYADISYSPTREGYRSVQCLVLVHGGNVVCWESSRQTIICHSTAESELISYTEGHQLGEALSELFRAVGNPVSCILYGDNVAAIASVNNETGSWRTRHLRLRAFCLREAVSVENPIWTIRWLAGSRLLADGGTKPLQGDSFLQFRTKLRVATGVDSSIVALRVARDVSPMSSFTKCQGMLLSGVALLAAGRCSLAVVLLVVAVGILKWLVGSRPETKDAQGPEPRPQQGRKKIWEGSANHENPLGLDRSGTVTPKMNCPAQECFGEFLQSEVGASLRMMRANEHERDERAQLPVRPRRQQHESTASARGVAAGARPVMLGRNDEGHSQAADDNDEPAAPPRTPLPPFRRSERTRALMYPFPLLDQPVRDPPGQVRVFTRVVSPRDPVNAVAVWDLEHFQRVPRGSDRWVTWWNGILVRQHGTTRRRSFVPLHRSIPVSSEAVMSQRCTIMFFGNDGSEREVHFDDWTARTWQLDELWRGFTIFDLRSDDPVNAFTSTSDGSFEVVEP